jgi:hypothetical protein
MLGIERPHLSLKVEQPVSTFAEGNARWYVTGQYLVWGILGRNRWLLANIFKDKQRHGPCPKA